MSFRWRGYAEKVSNLGELLILAFFVVPSLLLTVSMFGGTSILFVLVALPPVFGAVLYLGASGSRPRYPDVIRANRALPVALGVLAGVGALFLRVPPYLALTAGLLALGAGFTLQVAPQLKSIGEVESSLPQFLRDLTEYRKVGYDPVRSIERLADESARETGEVFEGVVGLRRDASKYLAGFRGVLSNFADQMSLGRPPSEAQARTGSWLGRFTFFMVQTLVQAGEVPPALLERLTEFTSTLVESKREARAQMRLYQILGLLTPPILAATMLVTLTMLSSFSTFSATAGGSGAGSLGTNGYAGSAGSGFRLPGLSLSPQVYEVIYLFIVESGFAIGLVVGKALNGTVMSMDMAIAAVAVGVITVFVVHLLQPEISSLLGIKPVSAIGMRQLT